MNGLFTAISFRVQCTCSPIFFSGARTVITNHSVNLHFIEDLKQLREQWGAILAESKLVSENICIEPVLPERRQKKRMRFADVQDDNEHINCGQEDHFRNNVFYVLGDSVIGNMTNRYDSIYALE